MKSETNFAETATRFTTHWSSGNWSDIEKELETGVRLIAMAAALLVATEVGVKKSKIGEEKET